MLTYQQERFTPIAQEFSPLFIRHFEEIAHDQERIPLAPDWQRYLQLDAEGRLFVLTARDKRLVGYFFAIVDRGLHNARSVIAKTDMYYLLPEHRKGRNGIRLITEAMKRMRYDKMIIQTKLAHDHGKLFERLGFTPVETVYTRVS